MTAKQPDVISLVELAAAYGRGTGPATVPAPRPVADVAATLPRGDWLLRPYLERKSIAVLYGDYGTLKSFVALDWALRVALGIPAIGENYDREKEPVVIISAEGRGLSKRLRAWAKRNYPDFGGALGSAKAYVIEQAVNLSDPATVSDLRNKIDQLAIRPALIVIDTLSRNSNGAVEASTADAAAYLALIDQEIRGPYGCCVLLVHHVGHTDKGRIRGPIVLAANTDAMIRLERPDTTRLDVLLTVERLKDTDPPAPASLRGAIVDLMEMDDDGQPMTSLAIEASPTAVTAARRIGGKHPLALVAGLKEWLRAHPGEDFISGIDLADICKAQGIGRQRKAEAVAALTQAGHLSPATGGHRVTL